MFELLSALSMKLSNYEMLSSLFMKCYIYAMFIYVLSVFSRPKKMKCLARISDLKCSLVYM